MYKNIDSSNRNNKVKYLIDFILPVSFMLLLLQDRSDSYIDGSLYNIGIFTSGIGLTFLYSIFEYRKTLKRESKDCLVRIKPVVIVFSIFLIWMIASSTTNYGKWKKAISKGEDIITLGSCENVTEEIDKIHKYKKSAENLSNKQQEHLEKLLLKLSTYRSKLCNDGAL